MKKTLHSAFAICAILLAGITLSSCEEDTGIVIGIPQTFETVYRLDPQTETTFNLIESVSFNLDSVLATQNATRDDIESISFTSTELYRTDSAGNLLSGANFANIKSVSFQIENTTAGLAVLASVDSAGMASYGTNNPITISATATSVGLDLVSYFANGTPTTFESNLTIYNPITVPAYIKSKVTITVNAKL